MAAALVQERRGVFHPQQYPGRARGDWKDGVQGNPWVLACALEKQGRRADREGRWVLGTDSVPEPVLAASI